MSVRSGSADQHLRRAGRDVVAALDGHPRRDDVSASRVELNGENVQAARARVAAARLANVAVAQADGALSSAYASHVPANVVRICGVFGSVANADIRRAIYLLPRLCAPSATVIWTRYCIPWRGVPDPTPTIREWFCEAGFAEVAFRTTGVHGVGSNQLVTPPAPFEAELRLFTFLVWKR